MRRRKKYDTKCDTKKKKPRKYGAFSYGDGGSRTRFGLFLRNPVFTQFSKNPVFMRVSRRLNIYSKFKYLYKIQYFKQLYDTKYDTEMTQNT